MKLQFLNYWKAMKGFSLIEIECLHVTLRDKEKWVFWLTLFNFSIRIDTKTKFINQ